MSVQTADYVDAAAHLPRGARLTFYGELDELSGVDDVHAVGRINQVGQRSAVPR